MIGAATMGSGVAICALDAGLHVTLIEQDAGALNAGRERILKHYERNLNADDTAERVRMLVCTTDWQSLTQVDAVIEAVFEDLAVKQEVFQRIDKLARPGALLASNTSYLDLDGIAGATQRPRDVVGLHFFSPAHVTRLMEVVRGTESSQQSRATAFVLAQRFCKLPVLTRNAFGFIGNPLITIAGLSGAMELTGDSESTGCLPMKQLSGCRKPQSAQTSHPPCRARGESTILTRSTNFFGARKQTRKPGSAG